MTTPKPRDYQIKCQQELYKGFSKGKTRGLIVAPTGAGKTMIASMITFDYVRRLGKRVLFVVHRHPLIGQTIEAMGNWGIKSGVVAGGWKEDRSALLQIASFQTLTPDEEQESRRDLERLLSWFQPDVVIYDECHVINFSGVALTLTPKLVYFDHHPEYRDRWLSIGLTATPYRLKSHESLGDIYQFITCAPMPRKLIEDGVLVQPIYYDVPNAGAGKIDVRITYIVDNWLKIGQDSKTIAFCPSVPFARALTQAFEAVGVSAAMVHGGTSFDKRDKLFKSFKSDATDTLLVLCSCMALTEGFDATNARCGIFARDTNSAALAIQMIGRIVRSHTYPDGSKKRDAIAMDCVGMFGDKFPYFEDLNITDASLYESDLKVSGDAPYKKCPASQGGCGRHVAVGAKVCDGCGFVFTIHQRPRIAPGGDMIQLVRDEQEKIAFYRRWLRYAFDKDKPPDFADRRFYSRFKSYPLDGWKLNAIYPNPTPEQAAEVKAYFKRHSFLSEDPDRWQSRQLSLELGRSSDRPAFDPALVEKFEIPSDRPVIDPGDMVKDTTAKLERIRSRSVSIDLIDLEGAIAKIDQI